MSTPVSGRCLFALLCIALCVVLAGCGSKRIGAMGEEPITGSQQGSVYLPSDDGKPLAPEEMDALISVGDFDRHVSGADMLDVVLHFKYYLHQGRRTVERNVERAEPHLSFIRSTLRQERLPGELAYLPFIESGYDTRARSRTGALGMWQFVRGTGDDYGMRRDWWRDERHCPYQSTRGAAAYLGKLYARFKDWHLAITAYNAGEGRVSRALAASDTDNFFELRRRNGRVPEKDRLSDENKQYLPRFLAVCKIMRNLGKLGFAAPNDTNARHVSEISVRPGTDLMAMARRIGMDWNAFMDYNPAYLRAVSPPHRATPVFVPQRLSAAAAAFARNPGKGGVGWGAYTVRKGDTFSAIARRTGVPAAELRRANQVGELKAGKTLRIPRNAASRSGAAAAAEPARPQNVNVANGAGGRNYTVRKGDTVYGLARAWDVTPDAIMDANSLSGSALSIGQKLLIPGQAAPKTPAAKTSAPKKTSGKARKTVTYTIRPGDTVWGIARKFDVNPAALMRANKLTGASTIRPGDTVRVIPDQM